MASIKKLVISLVGGIIVPFSYLLIAAPLADNIDSPAIQLLLLMPLVWPGYLWSNLTFLIVCDILLYGLITYAVFQAVTKEAVRPPPPPPPPRF
jgi:hypothetical protein